MTGAQYLNVAIIAIYMAALVFFGLYFSRRQTSTETYFVAGRAIPGWAMGISLLGTIITSLTFVAYPGAAYVGDWSLMVPAFMFLGVPALIGVVIVPFYRQAVRMSAYEYFGKRFGTAVRTYGLFMFAVNHLTKMLFVLYVLVLTVNSMTGWPMDWVLVGTSGVTILYAWIGGMEAIIWATVLQGVLLWSGVLVTLGYLFYLIPYPSAQILRMAWQAHKFSLGSTSLNLTSPNVMVLLLYGTFFYLQRYTADQTVVQRYLVARSDRQAWRGILLGAALCIPVWSLFMFLGTLLWSYYRITGEALPGHLTKADQIFPYFIVSHLPPGVPGLFLAALFGAGISMLASDLNSLGAVFIEDFWRRRRTADGRCCSPSVWATGRARGGLNRKRRSLAAVTLAGICIGAVVRGLLHRGGRIGRTLPPGIPQYACDAWGSAGRDCGEYPLYHLGNHDVWFAPPDPCGKVSLSVDRIYYWGRRPLAADRDRFSSEQDFPSNRRLPSTR